MVYHFTTAGIQSNCSSIQNVQRCRTACLDLIGVDSKYVFCGILRNQTAYSVLSRQNFVMDDIIWMPAFLCNRKLMPSNYTIDMFMRNYDIDLDEYSISDFVYSCRDGLAEYRLIFDGDMHIDYVDLYMNNHHVQRDCYMGYSLFYSEFIFDNRIINRRFYDDEGKFVYDQIFNTNDQCQSFVFSDRVCLSEDEGIRHFIGKLNLTKDDFVIIDGVGDCKVISSAFRPAKVALQLQSHHYNELESNDDFVTYSGYAAFFCRYRDLDCIIAATEEQKSDLDKHFAMTFKTPVKTYAIPVGCIDNIKQSGDRKKHSFISVANFGFVKRIDLLIQAMIIAHESVPDISLDIYGAGGWRNQFEKMISKAHAESYINIKGFCDMTDVYQNYDAHIMSTSSEGFSLATLESIAAGCSQVAYKNVKYSTDEFITDGENGFTADLYYGMSNDARIRSLAKTIVKYCNVENTESFHKKSYDRANKYLTKEVAEKWRQLLTEIMQ